MERKEIFRKDYLKNLQKRWKKKEYNHEYINFEKPEDKEITREERGEESAKIYIYKHERWVKIWWKENDGGDGLGVAIPQEGAERECREW